MINTTWSELKNYYLATKAPIRYIEDPNKYRIYCIDDSFNITTTIDKNATDTTDLTEFETTYKAIANIKYAKPTSIASPFGSKTIIIAGVEKKLYARSCGIQVALTAGANQINYTIPFPWCKITGIECVNAESLDYTDLKVIDATTDTNATPPVYPYLGVSGAILNQFSYANNIGKDFYIRLAQFDADIYQNMVIRLDYTSVSAKTLALNFILYEVKS